MERQSAPVYWLYALAAGLVLILTVLTGQFADPDLWGRLSVGALWQQTGHFPYTDVFSYTAPHARWMDHEWLSGVIFYGILHYVGEPAFLAFKYLLMLLTLALLFDLHRQSCKTPVSVSFFATLLLVPCLAIGYYATTRAQIFSLLLFMAFLWVLELIRLQKRPTSWLVVLIPLGVIWGNLHGGFILGILLCLLYGLGAYLQHKTIKAGLPFLLTGVAIPILLTVLNPYGMSYWPFLCKAWTLDRRFISEWRPLAIGTPDFMQEQLLTLVAAIFLLMAVIRLVRKRSWQAVDSLPLCLVLGLSIAMMIKAMRFEPFLALSLLAAFPAMMPPAWLDRPPSDAQRVARKSAFNKQLLVPILTGLSAIGGLLYLNQTIPAFRAIVPDALTMAGPMPPYPVDAIQYLQESPYHGNVMTGLDVGEFVYWALYPQFKIGMDGRFEEVYSRSDFVRSMAFYGSRNSEKIQQYLNQTHTDFILTTPHAPHVAILRKSGAWTMLYQGPAYWILGRTAIIKRFPPYNPGKSFLTDKTLTLADFTTQADIRRFKAEHR